MAKKRKLKIYLIIVSAVIILNLVIMAIIVSSLLRNTGQYAQQEPIITDSNQVSPYLTHYLAPAIWNGTQSGKPFEIIVEQKGINDILSRDSVVPTGWPIRMDSMVVYSPHVKFEPEKAIILGKVDYKGIEVYLTLHSRGEIREDGKMKIDVLKVQAGKLDVTRVAFFLAREMAAGLYIRENSLSVEERMVYGIIYNKAFDPVFNVGDDQIRLSSVKIKDKKLVLNFVPLP